jgi:hypothetical protein
LEDLVLSLLLVKASSTLVLVSVKASLHLIGVVRQLPTRQLLVHQVKLVLLRMFLRLQGLLQIL